MSWNGGHHTIRARRAISESLIGNTRASVSKGEKNHQHKLTASEVIEIFNSPLAIRILAGNYNVTKGCISHIKTGRNWSHITGAL